MTFRPAAPVPRLVAHGLPLCRADARLFDRLAAMAASRRGARTVAEQSA